MTFIEDSLRACSPFLRNASVIIHHNPLAELSSVMPAVGYVGRMRRFRKKAISPERELPSNVHLHVASSFYFVPDGSNRRLAQKVARVAERTIRKEKIEFDLIHAHFTWPDGGAGALLKKKFGVPLIVTAHGYDAYSLPFKDAKWKATISRELNEADCIVTVSQRNARCLRELDVSTPIEIIPNGFDDRLFHPMSDMDAIRSRLGLPAGRLILAVGNLERVKGHEVLIEAFSSLAKRDDVTLIIVGSGPQRAHLEKKVKELSLSGRIIFSGSRPHSEIPLWINACDVVALSSKNEGNPTVMFETLGCGKPFVGTRVGGVPDVITDDVGILCDPGDPRDLAEKLSMALDRQWDKEKIVAHARRFTWEQNAKQLLRIYERVIVNGTTN
ncbi:MAG: glycosyltransferase [Methanomassiliicoccus sp.]|nr:glycosyltransferase [Methanomassiliicoccus sp.]